MYKDLTKVEKETFSKLTNDFNQTRYRKYSSLKFYNRIVNYINKYTNINGEHINEIYFGNKNIDMANRLIVLARFDKDRDEQIKQDKEIDKVLNNMGREVMEYQDARAYLIEKFKGYGKYGAYPYLQKTKITMLLISEKDQNKLDLEPVIAETKVGVPPKAVGIRYRTKRNKLTKPVHYSKFYKDEIESIAASQEIAEKYLRVKG